MINTKIRLIIFFAVEDGEALYSKKKKKKRKKERKKEKTRPGADCGPDHEILIVKFRIKLKKVGN